jgi:catecholate siderophore receptor
MSSGKFTQPLIDTTQTINIIGSDLFNEQGATSLTDALRNSPGVGTFYVGENGNTTTGDAVNMRGFDSSSSIFVDGARDMGSITRDVFNIEQIEITKGPAGTDNGRSAPTGAINMVTKHASRNDAAIVTLSSGGSDGQQRAALDLNQSLGNGRAVRVNLMTLADDVVGRDEVEDSRWGLATSFAFGLGDNTQYFLDLLHIQQNNLPDGGVPTIGLPGYTTPDPARPGIGMAPKVDRDNFYGTTSDYDDVTADMVTLRIDHEFQNGMSLQNTTRWGRNEQDYMLTAFMTSQDPARFSTPNLNDPSTWEIARSLPTFKSQTNEIVTNHTNLVINFANENFEQDVSMGVELTHEELETAGMGDLAGSSWPAANLYHPYADVSGLQWGPTGEASSGSTDTYAAYIFDTIKIGDKWQLNGGIRYDRYETDYSDAVACGGRRAPACGALPAGSVVPGTDASTSDTLFNWKVGGLYKPTINSTVYVNYAISQQPPGGSSLELSSGANSPNNPDFDPQEAETSEIGLKWDLFDQNLLLTTVYYNTDVTNEIVQDPVDLNYYQTGKKNVSGIEISAIGKISDAWSLSTGFTTMDTEVESGPALSQDGSSNLTYTPDKAFTAWTTYVFPFGLTVGGGVRYSGEMHRGRDGAPGTPETTEDYSVWDAVISYDLTENVDLRLNIYNLLDEDYVAAINKSGYRYTPGRPLSFLLSASMAF